MPSLGQGLSWTEFTTFLTPDGDVGIGTSGPTALLDLEKTGTAKDLTTFLEITNSYQAADMDGTGSSILFNQWATDSQPYACARINAIANNDWTSTGTSQDAVLSFSYANNGSIIEGLRLSGNYVATIANGQSAGSLYFGSGNAAITLNSSNLTLLSVSGKVVLSAGSSGNANLAVTNNGGVYMQPDGIQSIVAGTGIAASVLKGFIKVQGSGGAVTVTATPSIAAGEAGQLLILVGASDTNTLTLQDESSLASSGLQLAGGANVTLGLYDTLFLVYSNAGNKWCEISRSAN